MTIRNRSPSQAQGIFKDPADSSDGGMGAALNKAGILAILTVLPGCAHQAPRTAKHTRKVGIVAPVRLGVLPPDTMQFAELAAALGASLKQVRPDTSGPWTEVVTTKVSMEVAQLSLECVTPTNDCYVAVGNFLKVDRMLWGQLTPDPDHGGVKVTVVLLDVELGAPVRRAERSFPEHGMSPADLQRVVDEAMHGPRGHDGPSSSIASKTDGSP